MKTTRYPYTAKCGHPTYALIDARLPEAEAGKFLVPLRRQPCPDCAGKLCQYCLDRPRQDVPGRLGLYCWQCAGTLRIKP